MAISKEKKEVRISLPLEVLKSMDMVVNAFRKRGAKITKSILITKIFCEWLEWQNEEIDMALKEEKENA